MRQHGVGKPCLARSWLGVRRGIVILQRRSSEDDVEVTEDEGSNDSFTPSDCCDPLDRL